MPTISLKEFKELAERAVSNNTDLATQQHLDARHQHDVKLAKEDMLLTEVKALREEISELRLMFLNNEIRRLAVQQSRAKIG